MSWKLPMKDGEPAVGKWDRWRVSRNPDNYEYVEPPVVEATLVPVRTFKSRSTAGVVFKDKDGDQHYRFTVIDLFEMLPHMKGGEIHGLFGWAKRGTAFYNTFEGVE